MTFLGLGAPDAQSPFPLSNKTAIVTGGSRGLGAEISYELARLGANVVIVSLRSNTNHAISLLSRIKALPNNPRAQVIMGDLVTEAAPFTIMHKVEQWLYAERLSLKIHILVNNAGVSPSDQKALLRLEQVTAKNLQYVFDLNVQSAFLMTQAVRPHLAHNGRIINISSVGARMGLAGMSLFCSSKAAIEGLTRCWAHELGANGTTVNAVAPGFLEDKESHVPKDIAHRQQDETPLYNKIGTGQDVAKVVAWLAGDDSRWVTGQTINACGGWSTL